jgi:hypothetical protein
MAKEQLKTKTDAEAARLNKDEKQRTTRRRNRQIIGFMLTVLILVGAVSIVILGINTVNNLFDTSEEYPVYENLFEPFVWFDVLPFASPAALDENMIKQICIWGVLNETPENELRRGNYGEPLISVLDMERYALRLFGPSFAFTEHNAFNYEKLGLVYGYDEEQAMYVMPITGLSPTYLPSVVEIIGEGSGVRRVVVGYVNTRTATNQLLQQPDFDNPAFYMDYVLTRDGNEFYLSAMQPNTEYAAQNAASSSSAVSEVYSAVSDSFAESSLDGAA